MMGEEKRMYCNGCRTTYLQGERHACATDEAVFRSSLDTQVGGDHYRHFAIQPVEFIIKNKLPFAEGNIIKYVCRHPDKGREEDVRKVIHYAEHILQFKYGVKL